MAPVPEWLASFSPAVQAAILPILDRPGRRVACLDADGTLWNEDIGEAFFRWLWAGGLLPPLDCSKDLWREYEERVAANRTTGYAWAVQGMAGLREADVDRWAHQMAAAWPNYRPRMAALIRGLTAAGVEVWIVSASSRWIMRQAAPRIGVDPDRVIAITTEVEDGVMTDRIVYPVICHEGKVEAIQAVIGQAPDLAIGDSPGDLDMLSFARQAVVVGRHDKPGTPILKIAAERGWPVELF